MAEPTDAHSCSFSGYSAGKDEEPGSVMPRASAHEAIVFAVYIWRQEISILPTGVPNRADLLLHRRQVLGRRGGQCRTALVQRIPSCRPAGTFHMTGRRIRCRVVERWHTNPGG